MFEEIILGIQGIVILSERNNGLMLIHTWLKQEGLRGQNHRAISAFACHTGTWRSKYSTTDLKPDLVSIVFRKGNTLGSTQCDCRHTDVVEGDLSLKHKPSDTSLRSTGPYNPRFTGLLTRLFYAVPLPGSCLWALWLHCDVKQHLCSLNKQMPISGLCQTWNRCVSCTSETLGFCPRSLSVGYYR